MGHVRLKMHHIRVGLALPFDVFDGEGHMLLCRGFVLESADQLERLIERGLYSDAAAVRDVEQAVLGKAPPVGTTAHRAPTVRVSIFPLLDEVRRGLATLLDAAEAADRRMSGVRDAAQVIQKVCLLDSDAALACIQLVKNAPYPIRHSVNVAVLTEILLKQLGAGEAERLSAVCGALTMNVAMWRLQETLYAQATPLSAEQKQGILAHAPAGAQWLMARGVEDAVWLDVVAQHHEAVDGSGYPARLKGEQICLQAQVVGLADRYCGMVSERAYRTGVSPNVALREIFLKHGTGIDTKLAAMLIKEMGIYPPGTLVVLANGEVGVVVKRTLNANHPVVRVVLTAGGKQLPENPKRLTSNPAHAVKGVREGDPLALGVECEKMWAPSVTEAETTTGVADGAQE